MDSGYLLIACGFVGLAITLSVWQNAEPLRRALDMRAWLTRGLYRGDLQALRAASGGRMFDLDPDQLKRLSARGFVARNVFGADSVTLKGRIALAVRTLIGTERLASN